MKVAIIPARGGSKRIPRKNIKMFSGKPMIEWSIMAAINSECFDRVIVSTDDAEVAKVATSCGAEVPFMRPASLSDDYTPTIPVIQHAIRTLENDNGKEIDYVCCIYATAPFIGSEYIIQGDRLIQEKQGDYAFSVTTFPFPIQRAIKIRKDSKTLEMYNPEYFDTRSQDLEEAYHDAGQFYWGRKKAWLSASPIFSTNSIPIILPRHLVQDIDTQEDWERAVLMHKALHA